MRNTTMVLLLLLGLIFSACGYTKEYVPIRSSASGIRIPNQQRLLAAAASRAVNRACSQSTMKFTNYSGKTGRVEINGILPHSDRDLLDYIASGVEGYMARGGMLVLPRERRQKEKVAVHVGAGQAQTTEVPDVRVLVSVDWGGIDLKDKKYIVGGKVAGMVVVGIFTWGIGAIIWGLASPPYGHIFTLDGKVKVTVQAVPVKAGSSYAIGAGEGSARIVIDTESDTGYTNFMRVPQDKKKQ